MLGSIRKFSKSFLAKIFIAIIALPFLMWGMGDVFRSGKQNVLVEINDEKISSKEFITYIQKIKLSKKEIENIGKSKILDHVLANYISEKIISIETLGNDNILIKISDTINTYAIIYDVKKNKIKSKIKR